MVSKYKVLCRNCNTTVARTPDERCIKCGQYKWGYTDAELNGDASIQQQPHKQQRPTTYNAQQPVPQHTQYGQQPPQQPYGSGYGSQPASAKLVCKSCKKLVAKTPDNRCINCGRLKWGYTDEQLANGNVKKKVVDPIKIFGIEIGAKQIAIAISLAAIVIIAIIFLPSLTIPKEQDMAKAVARVEVHWEGGTSTGTGFLISPTKLLTAAHVVLNMETGEVNKEADVIFTKMGNRKVKAKVLKVGNVFNENGIAFFLHDFAILEIDKVTDITPLKLGNSDDVKELSDVMTIGHSEGDPNLSFTDGKINSLSYGDENQRPVDLFKHDIPSNHGNSGGPIILKSNSTVIGILVGGRGVSTSGSRIDIPQGENIANKINNIKKEAEILGIDLSQ